MGDHLDLIEIDSDDAGVRTIFSTALYHSLIKPCMALNESPSWPMNSPFAFDLSTMWDIYRTQLPLLTTVLPERAVELGIALLHICENEGNLPIGYRMAKGADRFARQGSALAHPSWPICASSDSVAWTGTGPCVSWMPISAAPTVRST